MTTRTAFTPDEWTTILEGPTSAAMLVITASRGGTFHETIAEAKAYAGARGHHGQNELLDEIVAARPKTDHTRYHSADDLRSGVVKHLGDAVTILAAKATTDELDGYRKFVISLCDRVAAAHQEAGGSENAQEAAAIATVTGALGSPAS
jgi:hypothetical protein